MSMTRDIEVRIPYTCIDGVYAAYWGADKYSCASYKFLQETLEDLLACPVILYRDEGDKLMSRDLVGRSLIEDLGLERNSNAVAPTTERSSGGVKNDAGKPRADLLPSAALLEVAKVLNFGATKYADNNWRKGFSWSRLYGAAMRHILAHKDGENVDSESGLSHLSHAACCLLFLLEHELKGLGNDDRHKYQDNSKTK